MLPTSANNRLIPSKSSHAGENVVSVRDKDWGEHGVNGLLSGGRTREQPIYAAVVRCGCLIHEPACTRHGHSLERRHVFRQLHRCPDVPIPSFDLFHLFP